MNNNLQEISCAVTSEEIKRRSREFVDGFLKKANSFPSLVVDLNFYPTPITYEAENRKAYLRPIFPEIGKNRVTIHLCEEYLKEVPLLALQGWLDQELALCLLKLQPELSQFNFSKQILPIFPMSGSGVNLVRHMVERLKSGLEFYMATGMILDLGHGTPQTYFCFFKINPDGEESENYQRMISHSWIRASFLCRKLKEFMPLCLLAQRDVSFSKDLKSSWWQYHDYLTMEDRRILEEITDVPMQYVDAPYSTKLVEMFKRLRNRLFIRRNKIVNSTALH